MASANITTSGGIISDDFVDMLRDEACKHAAVTAGAFTSADTGEARRIESDITLAYDLLRARYESIRDALPDMDIQKQRRKWLLPVLLDLGSNPVYLKSNLEIDGAPTIEADFFYDPLDIVLVHGSIHHQEYVETMDADKEAKVKAAGFRLTILKPEQSAAARDLRLLAG